MKKMLFTLVFILGFTNLSFAQRSMTLETVDYMESSARRLDITHNIMTTPFVADLELFLPESQVKDEKGNSVSRPKRIEYTEKEAFNNYVVTTALLSNVPTFKAIALANAAKHYNADVILGALITVRTVLDDAGLGKLEITVSGYPARYCNFRTASQAEVDLIRTASYINSDANEIDVVSDTPEHKSSFLKEQIQIIK